MNSKYTKKQWFTLFVYCLVSALCSFCYALQGPFYPIEAETKGVSPSQYGIVFGIFSLFVFIFCPLSGMLIGKFGAVKISLIGILTIGIANIAFGFVNRINDSSQFIGTSVIIRAIEGIGFALSRNAAISIVSCEFSDNIEMSFAALQALSSLGHQIGPVVGGALFELGGFTLPFTVTGCCLLCSAFIVLFLPKDFVKQKTTFDKQLLELFKVAPVVLGIFAIFGTYIISGFILSTLEPHLRSLDLSPLQIGTVFFITSFIYCVSSFGWSKLCKTYDSSEYITIFSALFITCGLILIGPATYLPFNLTITSTVISVIILGIGLGGGQITGFLSINKGSKLANLSQDTETYAIVSAIYTASLSLGSFIGPLLGGYLYDVFGFAWGAHFFIIYQVILVLSIIIYCCFHHKKAKLDNSLINSSKEGNSSYNSIE